MNHPSYLLHSGQLQFLFIAPYSPSISAATSVSIEVDDVELAFSTSVAHSAKSSSPPIHLDNSTVLAEVHLYDDIVLRVSYKQLSPNHTFLQKFEPVDKTSSYQDLDFDIQCLDHAVGNVPDLATRVQGYNTWLTYSRS